MNKLAQVFKWLMLILLSVLLIAALSLDFLFFTNPGLRVSQKIANHFLKPYGVVLKGEISGQINALKIGELNIKNDTVDIRLIQVDVFLSLWSLISKQALTIKSLSLASIYVDVNTQSIHEDEIHTKDDTDNPFSMPLDLYATNISVSDVCYLMNNEVIVQAKNFNATEVTLIHDKLSLEAIVTNIPDYAAHATIKSGYIRLNSPFDAHLKMTLTAKQNGMKLTSEYAQIKGDFAGRFSIASDGIINYDDKAYPYQLISSFDQTGIFSNLKLSKNAIIENRLLFGENLGWTLRFRSLNPSLPIEFDIGGILKKIEHTMTIKSSYCDILSDDTQLRCNFNLSHDKGVFDVNQFNLANLNNEDHINLSFAQTHNTIKAKWNAFVAELNKYPFNLNGMISSQGQMNIDDQAAQNLDFTLNLSNFLYKKVDIAKLALSVKNQSLALDASSNHASMLIKAQFHHLSLSQVSARLQTFDFVSKTFKQHWRLTHETDIAFMPTQSHFNDLCLSASDNNHFCVNAHIAPSDIHIESSGEITPAQFIPNLPYGGDSFVLSFKGNYQQMPQHDPKANLDISGHGLFFNDNTSWFKQLQQAMPLHELSYMTNIKTYAILQHQKLTISSDVSFPQNTFNLKMNSNNFDVYDLKKATLDGTIDISSKRLSWISNFISQFPTLITKGALVSHLLVTGYLLAPKVAGKIVLNDAEVELLPLNIIVNNINANIDVIHPLNAKVNIEAEIQKSLLSVNGFIDLYSGTPNTMLQITGKNLLVRNTPDVEVRVTPDLIFHQENGNSSLNGLISIDKLIVNLVDMKNNSLQNTIQNDIVYVNNSNQVAQTQKTTPFSINININLGQNAQISGLGIDTNIQGNLNIISQPNQPMLGIGTLQPVNGVFSAYGKNFTVDPKSTIQFNNSPVDNPMLAITTYYNIPTSVQLTQVNAPKSIGIEITGMVNSPKIRLFSDPSMSQTDILSYILFGQVLTNVNSSQTSSDALSQAALLIAINEGGSGMIDELKDKLSLAEFALGSLNSSPTNTIDNTTAEQNNTAVFIGKQVTQRIYLSYGVGIFTGEQQGIATLSLTPQWKLKGAVTSFDRGGDLIYQTQSKD